MIKRGTLNALEKLIAEKKNGNELNPKLGVYKVNSKDNVDVFLRFEKNTLHKLYLTKYIASINMAKEVWFH